MEQERKISQHMKEQLAEKRRHEREQVELDQELLKQRINLDQKVHTIVEWFPQPWLCSSIPPSFPCSSMPSSWSATRKQPERPKSYSSSITARWQSTMTGRKRRKRRTGSSMRRTCTCSRYTGDTEVGG